MGVDIKRVGSEASAPARLLMVDDDVPYRTLCLRYLKRDPERHYEITALSSRAEVEELADPGRFDCILVDYYLPDCTGTELIEWLRDRLRWQLPPVVVISADGGEDAAIQSVRAHAIDFLSKRDITAQSLCRSIGNAVEKGELRRTVRERREELKRANVALERRTLEVQRFYHTVSHEMKTPLTAAREFVAIVHDGLAGDVNKEQRLLLSHALESCDQITRQFDDLLDLTRLETGKLGLDRNDTDLEPTLRRCLAMASGPAAGRSITLHREIQDPLPRVHMDAGRIAQVISNLLSNAIKFTEPGGAVTLCAAMRANGHEVEVRVTDNGRGMSKQDRLRVFDRLFQVADAGSDTTSSGLGLGLCIAREIVRCHDSDLKVHSELGVGSLFRFNLPCAPVAGTVSSIEVP